jgi:hypothetical protein
VVVEPADDETLTVGGTRVTGRSAAALEVR